MAEGGTSSSRSMIGWATNIERPKEASLEIVKGSNSVERCFQVIGASLRALLVVSGRCRLSAERCSQNDISMSGGFVTGVGLGAVSNILKVLLVEMEVRKEVAVMVARREASRRRRVGYGHDHDRVRSSTSIIPLNSRINDSVNLCVMTSTCAHR